MARWSRSSSFRTIPGSSVASSIRSCSRARLVRIRSSRASSRQPPRASVTQCRSGNHLAKPPTSVATTLSRQAAAFPTTALFLIAGPCQLEDDTLNLRVAEHLARLAERVPGGIIFKASFDKANRSNPGATRGPGLDAGLAALDRVRTATGLRVLTDVHLPEQCAPAAEVVDVLQIPAFLCRQTDLLVAAGATGKPVNIKKGQWMHPEGMRGAVEKVRAARGTRAAAGAPDSRVAITER